MGRFINKKKDLYTRFPLTLFLIVLGALSPFIIGFVGAYFTELITGDPCHEGNCAWMVIPWIGIFGTLPLGIIAFVVYIIVVLYESLKLFYFKKDGYL